MIDLLVRGARRTGADPAADRATGGRSPVLTAAAGGAVSAGLSLAVVLALALAGWFAADAGRYGESTDALRVGADAWLLAHGAGLRLASSTVSITPLALTLLCAAVTYRTGRRVGRRVGPSPEPRQDHDRQLLLLVGVLAAVYSVVALATAVLAGHERGEAGLFGSLLGGLVLSGLAGGSGVLVGTGSARRLLANAPSWARRGGSAALSTVLLLLAVSFFVVAGALLEDFGTAATVLSGLHADGAAGLSYTLVMLLFVPNAAVLASTYLLGPGFAVGAGSLVSPTAVLLGPLPAFPLLAALPTDGPTPEWAVGWVGVPVLVAMVACWLRLRSSTVLRYGHGGLIGLGAGVAAAALLAVLVLLAGGAAGPGRMAQVGADGWAVLLAGVVSLGGGGLIGGLVGTFSARRRASVSTPGPVEGRTPGAR